MDSNKKSSELLHYLTKMSVTTIETASTKITLKELQDYFNHIDAQFNKTQYAIRQRNK